MDPVEAGAREDRHDASLSSAADATSSREASPVDAGTADASPGAPTDAGPTPRTTRVSLVDHHRWVPLEAEDDPFEDRPEDVECAAEAVAAELLNSELTYSVDTGACRYVTARQSTQRKVGSGETLKVRLWHFELNAPNPGEAHAVVEVDGIRLLDKRVPIPEAGGLIKAEMQVERAIPLGAPAHFHLHNHGANSWALVEVSTGP